MNAVPFHAYINRLCAEKDVLPAYIIKKSGIERTFGHQIFNGKRNPSRDKIILLAFGFDMDYDETQALLKSARKSALYPKIERPSRFTAYLKAEDAFSVVNAMKR
jgi:transcriptional regulator with XRE-family HTH domain